MQITAYNSESITVDQRPFPNSLVLFPYQLFCWEVERGADVRLHHFDVLKIITPVPGRPCCYAEYIIIAVKEPETIDSTIVKELEATYKNVDVLPLVIRPTIQF